MAAFIISQAALRRNAELLRRVAREGDVHVLLALKAFATTGCLSVLRPYAAGCCASGLYEALLGAQEMGGRLAVYSPAYEAEDLAELVKIAHHLDFNSLGQWERFAAFCMASPRAQSGEMQFGLRVNPAFSTGKTPLYDPCRPGSRLGIDIASLPETLPRGISGLHIHTLCEQGAQDLIDTFHAFEKNCGFLLRDPSLRYLNLGGGHWITQEGYEVEKLVEFLRGLRQRYNGVEIYLEPGEAWSIHTGVLRARVLDVFESMGFHHAILDVSATAHTPDVLEMPYRPDIFLTEKNGSLCLSRSTAQPAVQLPGENYYRAGQAGEMAFTCRIGGVSCLAGDVFGDYAFPRALAAGDILTLDDMAHYTIVKTTHFNGVKHPGISLLTPDGALTSLRRFDFADFKNRLG